MGVGDYGLTWEVQVRPPEDAGGGIPGMERVRKEREPNERAANGKVAMPRGGARSAKQARSRRW